MGSCVLKQNKPIKTLKSSNFSILSSMKKSLVSNIHTLQHISNSCTQEIQNSVKGHNSRIVVLLKLKQIYIKEKQKSIQNYLFQLDELQEPMLSSAKTQVEIQKATFLIDRDIKINPIYSSDLKSLAENSEEQFKLFRIFELCRKNVRDIELEAENEVKNHKLLVDSGKPVRYRYLAK